ncbi:MAG: DNA repair protein RecN [Oscillospiraceae bacterium]
MLYELYIENLAVIKSARIPFSKNFNVFTGETGAGKSILINGINSILGQRMTKDIVRTGEKKAIVTALFVNLDTSICQKLDELNISHDENMITITREILADGGSIARINSRAVAISILKEVGQLLVDVHGQHDNQILLNPEKHIHIIDDFGDSSQLLNDYKESFKKLQSLARKIGELKRLQQDKQDRLQLLKSKVDEISKLDLIPNEDDELEEEYSLLCNAEKIINALDTAYKLINDLDNSAMENILQAKSHIERYSNFTESISPLCERLSTSYIELKDISEELLVLSNSIDLDPSRLEYLAQRRLDLNHIKKKYSMPLNDIIKMYEDDIEEISNIEGASSEIENLNIEKDKLLFEVTEKAKKLSQYRKSAVKKFEECVSNELEFLNMPNVQFKINQQIGNLTVNGMDSMEFLISTNLGEPPKPISKIASGGELSRVMLALKNVIADKDNIPTLIFDEIDTGVSGKTAQRIGIKLKEISKIRQVICVTHLTQIAIMGDNHLLIEKQVENDRTSTKVTQLDYDGRVNEIARIMNGEHLTDTAKKNAQELLNSVINN